MDYGFPIHNIGKSERIDLLESSVIGNCGYLYKKLCLKFQSIQDRFILFVCLFFLFCSFCLVYVKLLIVWTSISL